MNWRSKRGFPEKRDRADLVALALASLVVRAGERVAVLGTGERPISGKVAMDRLTQRILGRVGYAGAVQGDLPAFEPLPRYSTLVFIGDLLAPLEALDKLVRRFDTNSYVVIGKAMDLHDVGRGRNGLAAAMARIRVPTLTLGIWSDILYPTYQQREIRDLLVAQGTPAEYVEIDSPHGHDGFLLAIDQVGAAIEPFLDKVAKG